MQERARVEQGKVDGGKKLRYQLDMLHYAEEPKDAEELLEASAQGRGLFDSALQMLQVKGEQMAVLTGGGLNGEETCLGLVEDIVYMDSKITMRVKNREGTNKNGISIQISRPHEPYSSSGLLKRVNLVGRFRHNLKQETWDIGTPYLIVYPDQVGHSELGHVTSFNARFGERREYFRKPRKEEIALFAGALEVLVQK